MTRTFFLGPGYYEGESEPNALHDRRRLAELLAPNEVRIMEADNSDDQDLVKKFISLSSDADEVLIWLPSNGKLNTVYGELLLLRTVEKLRGKRIIIFAQDGMLDVSTDEFQVLDPTGQIAYLLDLPRHFELHTFEYDTWAQLESLLRLHAAGGLEPVA